MQLNEYQELSKRTMPAPGPKTKANYALGLVCEAGEVGDEIKKEVFHRHPENREKVKDELGDVLHYLSGTAALYGWTLDEIATHNLLKLAQRYPEGFSAERSRNREGAETHGEHDR